ncbi:MAG: methyltransferase [Pigmentiphaga sp.]|uniref:methyltransferase n=1 Tax=Pigmentiphaga sp. TaxID=1977564 RepID=UPI003B570F89
MFPNLLRRPAPHKPPLFAPGTLKLSEKVHWLACKGLIDPLSYVHHHVRGDWGEIDEAGRQANSVALEQGAPMTSRFQITPRLFLIVVTSDDQGITVVQLPEERDML